MGEKKVEETMRMSREQVKQRVIPVLKRHDVAHAAIFGSFAREEAGEESDLDILVEFGSEKSLLDLVTLQLELEEVLRREVDVLTFRALHPRIRERVLKEQVMLL
jgi:predicted nucleotidyltransferase